MTELKTLKDIDCAINHNCEDLPYAVDIDELKAEAIKWVKAINEDWKNNPYAEGAKDFIGRFFNLTEEDLK